MRNGVFGRLTQSFVAIFLASIVWFVVSAPRRGPVSERAFAGPLAVVSMPRDLIITTPVPDTVNVRIDSAFAATNPSSGAENERSFGLECTLPGCPTSR